MRELRVGARVCQCAACLEKAKADTAEPVVEPPVVETPAPTTAAKKEETVPDAPSLSDRIRAARGHVAEPTTAAAAPTTIDPQTVPAAPDLGARIRAARGA